MRTKAQIHCLTGHTNTVAEVRCQAAEPQVRITIVALNHNLVGNHVFLLLFMFVSGDHGQSRLDGASVGFGSRSNSSHVDESQEERSSADAASDPVRSFPHFKCTS